MFRLALALLALSAAPAAAQHVKIGLRHRVPNLPQGYCVPASVETAGRHLGVTRLYGYRDRKFAERGGRSGGMYPSQLASNLTRMGVRFDQRHYGDRDYAWLSSHLAHGRPVVAVVRSSNSRPPDHAVLVTGMNNGGVTVFDPNPPHDRRHTYGQWTHRWAGGGFAVYPNR